MPCAQKLYLYFNLYKNWMLLEINEEKIYVKFWIVLGSYVRETGVDNNELNLDFP
jgi:hypothetical protein